MTSLLLPLLLTVVVELLVFIEEPIVLGKVLVRESEK